MTRLTVAAAALVAGMAAFAANAQEAPEIFTAAAGQAGTKPAAGHGAVATGARAGRGAAAMGFSTSHAAVDPGTPTKSARTDKAPAKPERTFAASAVYEQGMVFVPQTGLDDTRTASTGKRERPTLIAVARGEARANGEAAEVLENVRYVRDGNVVTAAGVSAGIDMALTVVARYFGEDIARAAARNMEYPYPNDNKRRIQL